MEVPRTVRGQLKRAVRAFRRVLGNNLSGIHLHGSLAMGGFNPRRSDIDLLVVTRRHLSNAIKRKVIEAMLEISGSSRPIEMSIVARADIFPWRHPAPFQLCWSEDWRTSYEAELIDGRWRRWNQARPRDADLAAHLAMTRVRGVTLFGARAAAALPFVPMRDLIDSLTSDGRWALRLLRKDPAMHRYVILNACRRLALARRGFFLSKAEGAAWAVRDLPRRWHRVIANAQAGRMHPQMGAFLGWMARQERSALPS